MHVAVNYRVFLKILRSNDFVKLTVVAILNTKYHSHGYHLYGGREGSLKNRNENKNKNMQDETAHMKQLIDNKK